MKYFKNNSRIIEVKSRSNQLIIIGGFELKTVDILVKGGFDATPVRTKKGKRRWARIESSSDSDHSVR